MTTDLPDGAFSADISDYQFRLLAVLCRLTGPGEAVQASATSLGVMTGGTHRTTVLRALAALESASLISREKTRKAGGYQGSDRITVLGRQGSASATLADTQGSADATLESNQGSASATATGDYMATSTNSHSLMTSKPNSRYRNTSYSYPGLRPGDGDNPELKEVIVAAWKDDDDIPGFGMIDDPDHRPPAAKVSKRSTTTRGKRPQEEWTTNDVAAEFAFMLYRKFPQYTGLLKTVENGRILMAARKRAGTEPLVELEMVRMFLSDERNLRNLDERLHKLFGAWIACWPELLPKARKVLGVSEPAIRVPAQNSATVAHAATGSNKIAASDGRLFDNTVAGRAFRKKYEERLNRA